MTKYLLLGLLVPSLAACQVDNDVADDGESTSAEARVAGKSGDFCESTCTRLRRCEIDGLIEEEDCPDTCREFMEETFLNRGEECARAGERFMSCISQASCEAFENDPKICQLSDAEEEACDANDEPPQGGGTTEPIPGPARPTGKGPVVCSASSASGPAPGAESFACDTTWDNCSDGRTYAASCVESSDGPPVCTCSIDGEETGTFSLVELTCPSDADIKVACDFWVVGPMDHPAFPDPTLPAYCEGMGANFPAGGCSLEFSNCDGHSYHLECVGSGGTERCVCYVDGQPTGSFRDPDDFCPSHGADEEFDTVNAGCGWYVAN